MASAMDLCYGVLWLPHGAGLIAKLIWHVESAPLVDGHQPVVCNQPVSSAVGDLVTDAVQRSATSSTAGAASSSRRS